MTETDINRNSDEEENAPDGQPMNSGPSKFDEFTAVYEELASWNYRRYIEIPHVLRVIGDVSGLSIMDYGCGTGTYSRSLKNAGAARVVCFDPSRPMLEYARERAKELGYREVEFTSELVPETHNGQFDLVLAIYVLPYATTKAELNYMCTRMGNLLKPGGRLITLPIHPDYNLDPEYYAEYGLRLTQQKQLDEPFSYVDGGPVQLHLCHGKWDIRIMATYWSRASLTHAMIEAGFSTVTQVDLGNIDVDATLEKYVRQPHAAVIECTK